jgi:hypothetical protein
MINSISVAAALLLSFQGANAIERPNNVVCFFLFVFLGVMLALTQDCN